MYTASQTTVLYMKRLNKTESPIFVLACVLCFQRQPLIFFLFYFTAVAGVKCRVAVVERLSVLHHTADNIFISFGAIELILVALKLH